MPMIDGRDDRVKISAHHIRLLRYADSCVLVGEATKDKSGPFLIIHERMDGYHQKKYAE